jgi:hypothetical protein
MSTSVALVEMLKLVEEHELGRCREALTRAHAQAQVMRREAQRVARARMHAHIQALKQERRRALALASAELDTAQRQHRNRCDYALIETGLKQLDAALANRWQDAAARHQWVERVVRNARARLPRERWEISHPPGWPESEQRELAARLAPELGAAPVFRAEIGIRAGLCVRAGTARLDGTLDGLLADRAAIEALMLAELAE